VSTVDLHWSAWGLLSVVLGIAAPGLLAGGVLGALAWPARRATGAALGGVAGAAIGALLITMVFGVQLPMGF
jgi:hypothetical protein